MDDDVYTPPPDWRPFRYRFSFKAWLRCRFLLGGHDWLQTWSSRHECRRCGARSYRDVQHEAHFPE